MCKNIKKKTISLHIGLKMTFIINNGEGEPSSHSSSNVLYNFNVFMNGMLATSRT